MTEQIVAEKLCKNCREVKPVSLFPVHTRLPKRIKYRSHCKACQYEAEKRQRQIARPRRDKQPRHSEAVRDRLYRQKYSLSLAQYEEMLTEQGGVCFICEKPPKQRRLYVDHCHRTGVVRKLLCPSCNLVVGHVENRPGVLRRAIQYVKSHASP